MEHPAKYNADTEFPYHETAHPEGGIHLKDDARKIQQIVIDVLKRVGVKLAEGSVTDLLKITRPATICYHKTFIEALASDLAYTHFLDKAALETDPIKRMSLTIAFFVSGWHRNPAEMQNKGPLSPIVGETFQACKKDGTRLYCEQISTQPMAAAYLLCGKDNQYRVFGSGEFDVKMSGMNNITGKRSGRVEIEFKDGGKIICNTPELRIDNLVMGDRRLNYITECVFTDKTNQISAELKFKYKIQGTLKKYFNKFKSFLNLNESSNPSDRFDVKICAVQENSTLKTITKETICEGCGSWLSFLQIDEEILWKITDPVKMPWESPENKLPSDSRFRADSKFVEIKEYEKAQAEIDRLDNLQKNDSKLREIYMKSKKNNKI